MKAYEKWKDDSCVEHCSLCHIGVCGECDGLGTKEEARKAALEWVLENSECKGLCDSVVCTDTIVIIEKELKS